MLLLLLRFIVYVQWDVCTAQSQISNAESNVSSRLHGTRYVYVYAQHTRHEYAVVCVWVEQLGRIVLLHTFCL